MNRKRSSISKSQNVLVLLCFLIILCACQSSPATTDETEIMTAMSPTLSPATITPSIKSATTVTLVTTVAQVEESLSPTVTKVKEVTTPRSSPTRGITITIAPIATPTHQPEKQVADDLPVLTSTATMELGAANSDLDLLVDYEFKPPQLIFEANKPINIVQWIPESNDELLIRSSTSEKFIVDRLNIATGQRKRLVEADNIIGDPVWLTATQQVAYLSQDRTTGVTNLFVSNSDRQNRAIQSELIRSQVSPPLVPTLDGENVLFFNPQLNGLQGTANNQTQSLDTSLPEPLYGGPFARYQAAWNDKTEWILFYNQQISLLVNGRTGETKPIELNQGLPNMPELWTSCAQWSPNGQKLGLIIASGADIPLLFTKLVIFDPKTEDIQRIDVDVPYVTDMAWAPDNQHVLMESQAGDKDGYSLITLSLVNSLSQQIIPVSIIPDEATQTSFCDGLAWDPDGNKVFLTYDTILGDGQNEWYLINVE